MRHNVIAFAPDGGAAAVRDDMTGLPSQVLVWEMLEHGLKRAARDQKSLAVLLVYLEGFGEINRNHGSEVGDRALLAVTGRLKHLLRSTDTVGRFGGPKLAILLETMSEMADIQLVAEKVVEAVREPIQLGGLQLKLSCSIGISLYPCIASDPETLIRCATDAMDAVKDRGGNGFQFA
ncbi:MAG: GGDEF domain-containing protein [Alphaproteobacteria bacterium]|nr:GGDEF domain-containing protein [Alphaproteobacteria bacterium]